jgi:hypothetical protein
MKKIIYRTSSGVAVVTPATIEISIEQITAKDLPHGAEYSIVDESKVPKDRTFREAWEYSESQVIINPDKAKAIWKNRWRDARKPLLEKLDVEFMRAVESADGARQAEIAAQKQALRDVTLTPIDGTTPEAIKAVWPAILNDPL